jgi:hypothetical protein
MSETLATAETPKSTRRRTRPAPGQPTTNPNHGLVPTTDPILTGVGLEGITLAIPDNATYLQVLPTVQKIANALTTIHRAEESVIPLLGVALAHVRHHNLWKQADGGYKTFAKWIEAVVVPMGVSRSRAFDSIQIADGFPSLTESEYRTYGSTKLLNAVRYNKRSDVPTERTLEILKFAQTMSATEFAEKVRVETKLGEDRNGVVLSMRVSNRLKTRWLNLVEDSQLESGKLLTLCIAAYKASLTVAAPEREVA